MNAIVEAEKSLGRMAKEVGVQRGLSDDIETIDTTGNLFFNETLERSTPGKPFTTLLQQ